MRGSLNAILLVHLVLSTSPFTASALTVYKAGIYEENASTNEPFEIIDGEFRRGFAASRTNGVVRAGTFVPFSAGSSKIDIYGGTFRHLSAGNSNVNIYGGVFEQTEFFQSDVQANSSTFNIYGGTFFTEIQANGARSMIQISGGQFFKDISANGGAVTITGGQFSESIHANGNGSVRIFGAGFKLNGEPVGYGPIGAGLLLDALLIGTLQSGEAFSVKVFDTSTGRVILVPEPMNGTLIFSAASLLALSRHV